MTKNAVTGTAMTSDVVTKAGMSGAGVADLRARRVRWTVALLLAAGVAIFIGANAHLVYVAFASRPDCVPHLKEAGSAAGAFRAADSAC